MTKDNICLLVMVLVMGFFYVMVSLYRDVSGVTLLQLMGMKDYCEEKAITGECVIVFIDKRKIK